MVYSGESYQEFLRQTAWHSLKQSKKWTNGNCQQIPPPPFFFFLCGSVTGLNKENSAMIYKQDILSLCNQTFSHVPQNSPSLMTRVLCVFSCSYCCDCHFFTLTSSFTPCCVLLRVTKLSFIISLFFWHHWLWTFCEHLLPSSEITHNDCWVCRPASRGDQGLIPRVAEARVFVRAYSVPCYAL